MANGSLVASSVLFFLIKMKKYEEDLQWCFSHYHFLSVLILSPRKKNSTSLEEDCFQLSLD